MLEFFMNISLLGVAIATIAQFVIGAVWYSFIFGKAWGEIHGFDKLPAETQKEMASKMGPFYGVQLLVTIFQTVVLAYAIKYIPEVSPYLIALLIWIGFIIPTQYSDVAFGGTEGKWTLKKLAILGAASLVCLLAGAFILSVI